MIKKALEYIKRTDENFRTYYREAEKEIKESNLRSLEAFSVLAVILIVVFSIITAGTITGWVPSKYHFILFGVMLVYSLGVWITKKKLTVPRWVEQIICSSFLWVLCLALCALDTVISPDKSQIFVSLFMICAPIIFIISFVQMLIYEVGYLVLFTVMAFTMKPVVIAETDFLAVFLSLLIGIVIYSMIMNLRVRDYMEKYSYKRSSEVDSLTSVVNRKAGKNRIDHILEQKKPQTSCALFVLDIDNFKSINDTLGHAMGDQVLTSVAKLLTEVFRKTDVVGRFGGDEFIVFLQDFTSNDLIRRKCCEIEEQMRLILEGRFNITCSIGVCIINEGDATMEKMFKVADDALYATKTFHKGKFTIHEYNSDNHKADEKRPLMVIVDDNMVDREVIAVQFEEDFNLEKFQDGKSAAAFIQENCKDIAVILLDMIMPEMSGMDVLKTIRSQQETRQIPVIAMSSDEMKEEEALLFGAEDMIKKPIVPAIARLRVHNVMKNVRK